MAGKEKTQAISKDKAVILIAADLYEGKTTKDILRTYQDTYGVSLSTVEKWIRFAKVTVEERRKEEERALVEANITQTVALANKLGITKERVMQEYAHIALFDPRKLYDSNGKIKPANEWDDQTAAAIGGIENSPEGFPIKLAINSKKGSLDQISKMMGYVIPEKGDVINNNINIDQGDIIFE